MIRFSHRQVFLLSLFGYAFIISGLVLAFPLRVASAATPWVAIPTPKEAKTYNTLVGIARISSTDAWTVGSATTTTSSNSLIEHWNGHSWKVVPAAQVNPGDESLAAVAAVSHNDVWAVGTTYLGPSRAVIEHWNGIRWSIVPAPTPPLPNDSYALTAVTALSSNNVWAVGYHIFYRGQQSLAFHWDGIVWSVIPTPAITQGTGDLPHDELDSVTAISPNDIWAAGSFYYGGLGLIEHWDGTAWNEVTAPAPPTGGQRYNFKSIAADAAGHVWVVGEYVNVQTFSLIEQWNGTSWTIVPSPQPPTIGSNENDTLNGVTIVSGTSAWAVGNYNASTPSGGSIEDTLVEHWDGTNWIVVPSPNVKTSNVLYAVTSFQGQTGAVGASSTSNSIQTLVIGCNCT